MNKEIDLRDYFVGLVMQKMINLKNLQGSMTDYIIIARHAYYAADAMLKIKIKKE